MEKIRDDYNLHRQILSVMSIIQCRINNERSARAFTQAT